MLSVGNQGIHTPISAWGLAWFDVKLFTANVKLSHACQQDGLKFKKSGLIELLCIFKLICSNIPLSSRSMSMIWFPKIQCNSHNYAGPEGTFH